MVNYISYTIPLYPVLNLYFKKLECHNSNKELIVSVFVKVNNKCGKTKLVVLCSVN